MVRQGRSAIAFPRDDLMLCRIGPLEKQRAVERSQVTRLLHVPYWRPERCQSRRVGRRSKEVQTVQILGMWSFVAWREEGPMPKQGKLRVRPSLRVLE